MWRFLQSKKYHRGSRRRTLPRTMSKLAPKSIEMIPKKKKNKKRETHPSMVKKKPLLMRRRTTSELGKERAKIPLRKMQEPQASHTGKSRGLIDPNS